MATCQICGAPLVSENSAWGRRCGRCLAAQIEMSLLGDLALARRKPPKRAIEIEREQQADLEELMRRVG